MSKLTEAVDGLIEAIDESSIRGVKSFDYETCDRIDPHFRSAIGLLGLARTALYHAGRQDDAMRVTEVLDKVDETFSRLTADYDFAKNMGLPQKGELE